jgi:TM2 domain-containing membrane protein YozV
MKDSRLSLVLSFLFPGLGQIYNGDTEKGILFVLSGAVSCVIALLFLGGLVAGSAVWVWSMFDAYMVAERTNSVSTKQ